MNINNPNPYTDGTLDLGSEPFKPETDGESLTINVTGVRKVATKDGEKTGVVVEGIDTDGVQRDWVAWNLANKGELRREQPLPGDTLTISYVGRDPRAPNPALAARWFRLEKLGAKEGSNGDIPF